MSHKKYNRMKNEYTKQCNQLCQKEIQFRKIGRRQIQEKALAQNKSTCDVELFIRRGIKSLDMTPELCGLLRKINNARRMLFMNEIVDGRRLLR